MRNACSLFLLFSLALSGCEAPPVDGQVPLSGEVGQRTQGLTLLVPAEYPTINAALSAAAVDDIVSVAAGAYDEDILLPGGVWLQGAGIDETTILGSVTVVGGEGGLLSLTVQGPGASAYTSGITAVDGNSIYADSVRVNDWYEGFFLSPGPDPVVPSPRIDGCSLGVNGYGVAIDSGVVTVTNTYVAYSVRSGLYAEDGASIEAVNNTLVGNSFGGNTEDRDAAISLGFTAASVVRNNSITSNLFGIQCAGCTADMGFNNVWGNVTNFAGDVSSSSSDLNVDPIYENLTAGNLRLQDTSPLIDAGSLIGAPDRDWDGLPRPSGAGVDIGADEWTQSLVTLQINEVMANPEAEYTGEYVELVNVGGSSVDLAGLVLSDGDASDTIESFDGGETTLAPGGIAVIVDRDIDGDYDIPSSALLVTVDDASLGNGLTPTDPITLYEDNGYVVVSEWSRPFDPGDGSSVERVSVSAPDVSSNWVVSPCEEGRSPGDVNCAAGPLAPNDPSTLVITEVMTNAIDEATGEFVELWNNSDQPVNASGLVLMDSSSDDILQGWSGGDTVIPADGIALIVDPGYEGQYLVPQGVILLTTEDATLGNGLANATDTVWLYDTDGSTLIDSYSHAVDPGDGVSREKIDYAAGDASSNWEAATCPAGHSAGRLNCSLGGVGLGLVINEVMNNPLNEQTGEYVEVYNITGASFELAGLHITDGDETDMLIPYEGGPTVLEGDGYALIIDANFAGDYSIPADAVVLTTADRHLGNGLSLSDPVHLLEADGISVIDTWAKPFNPGNGYAVEKVNAYVGDEDDNWEAATSCAGGGSPGAANCASYVPIPTGTTTLFLTEVMANPLFEASGEYLEVYNYGDSAVDLWGLVVFDGDAWDFVREYGSSSTVLGPGEYGLIIDRNFALDFDIPSGTTVVTVDDNSIGSGLATTDDIYLYEPDGYSLIDGWSNPFNPGNGTSVEKIDFSAGDVVDNWVESPCGSSPGLENCAVVGPAPAEDECLSSSDCDSGTYCTGIPYDGAPPVGICRDTSFVPGEGSSCTATDPCGLGLVCTGLTMGWEVGICNPDWMSGTWSASPSLAIPDNDPNGVSSSVVVYGQATVPQDIVLTVDISHSFRGDLQVVLTDPNGAESLMWDREGGEEDDLVFTLPVLSNSRDDSVNGFWTLTVRDLVVSDVGILNSWSLDLTSRWD